MTMEISLCPCDLSLSQTTWPILEILMLASFPHSAVAIYSSRSSPLRQFSALNIDTATQ